LSEQFQACSFEACSFNDGHVPSGRERRGIGDGETNLLPFSECERAEGPEHSAFIHCFHLLDHGKTPWCPYAAVDENVAVESPGNHKTQQIAIGYPRLLETEAIENRRFHALAGIRLGRRCALLWRIFRFNSLEIEGVEW
jgi:hypothetical protein